MPYRRNYPRSVGEVLDANARYRPDCLRAIRAFRREKPWRGTLTERLEKFRRLHAALCQVYNLGTKLTFGPLGGHSSGSSFFMLHGDLIHVTGRLSVVTYLHELAHARGADERRACRWSINLFRRMFPLSFAHCRFVGHMLINDRPAEGPAVGPAEDRQTKSPDRPR